MSDDELAVRALLPAATIIVGGSAFVGCIEPQPPLYGLLALPAAALGLWVSAVVPLKRRSNRTVHTVQIGVVGSLLVAAAAQVYFAS